jgi:hypothetical protein
MGQRPESLLPGFRQLRCSPRVTHVICRAPHIERATSLKRRSRIAIRSDCHYQTYLVTHHGNALTTAIGTFPTFPKEVFAKERLCLAHSRPSRAVNRNGNRETLRMVSVRPGRVDHEVELVGVDPAHFCIGHFGPDEWGIGAVREPAHTPRVAVLHPRHRIRRALRPRQQEWLAQAFDLNARTARSARNNLESLVEWVPRPRQCHPCEQLQRRENCGCFKSGLTGGSLGGRYE